MHNSFSRTILKYSVKNGRHSNDFSNGFLIPRFQKNVMVRFFLRTRMLHAGDRRTDCVWLLKQRPLSRQNDDVSTKAICSGFFLVFVVCPFPFLAKEIAKAEFHSRMNECARDCAPPLFSLFSAGRFIPNRDPRRLSNGSGTRRDVRDRRKPRWVVQDWEGDVGNGKANGRTDESTRKRVSGRPTFLNRPGLR